MENGMWKVTMRRSFAFVALGLLVAPLEADASTIVYDLSGVTNAPVELRGPANRRPANHGYEWQVDWSGAVLTHELGQNPNDFRDDRISVSGVVRGCVGVAGGNCFDSGDFERLPGDLQHIYVGSGDFELVDVGFTLNNELTNSTDDLIATAGWHWGWGLNGPLLHQNERPIGSLELLGQNIDRAAQTIRLGLKQNTDLGYAFRLFDEDPHGDGLLRILSWITNDSHLFGGRARGETAPGEAVFNGDLYACLRGAQCFGGGGGGPTDPPTEVPEPLSVTLLGIGLLGLKMRQRATV